MMEWFYLMGNRSWLFNGELPNGDYSFQIPPELWNNAMAGTATQSLKIVSHHPNSGHYIVSTGYDLSVGVSNSMTYACASSQEEAKQAVEAMYPCNALKAFNATTDVYEKSVWNMGEIKSLLGSIAEANGYQVSVSHCYSGRLW